MGFSGGDVGGSFLCIVPVGVRGIRVNTLFSRPNQRARLAKRGHGGCIKKLIDDMGVLGQCWRKLGRGDSRAVSGAWWGEWVLELFYMPGIKGGPHRKRGEVVLGIRV